MNRRRKLFPRSRMWTAIAAALAVLVGAFSGCVGGMPHSAVVSEEEARHLVGLFIGHHAWNLESASKKKGGKDQEFYHYFVSAADTGEERLDFFVDDLSGDIYEKDLATIRQRASVLRSETAPASEGERMDATLHLSTKKQDDRELDISIGSPNATGQKLYLRVIGKVKKLVYRNIAYASDGTFTEGETIASWNDLENKIIVIDTVFTEGPPFERVEWETSSGKTDHVNIGSEATVSGLDGDKDEAGSQQ